MEQHGKRVEDLAGAAGDDFIVSRAFKDAWEKESLTGLSFTPAKVELVSGPKAATITHFPEVYHIRPEHDGSRIDDEASGVIRQSGVRCSECGGPSIKSIERVCLDLDTLTGRDLFYCSNLAGVAVGTPRFAQMVKDYDLYITQMGPCEEYGYSYDFSY
jgi:hypothetical protein